MRDSTTGRSRGFGFLTFRDPKTVNTVMVKEHYLDSKIVGSLLCENVKGLYLQRWSRLIPSALSRVTSKRRQARSLLAVLARKPLSKTSSHFSCNSGVWSMLPL